MTVEELLQTIGYKEVLLCESERKCEGLTALIQERDKEIAELKSVLEALLEAAHAESAVEPTERPLADSPVPQVDLEGIVIAHSIIQNQPRDVNAIIRAAEDSKTATSLIDVPITLTPDAFRDKRIN